MATRARTRIDTSNSSVTGRELNAKARTRSVSGKAKCSDPLKVLEPPIREEGPRTKKARVGENTWNSSSTFEGPYGSKSGVKREAGHAALIRPTVLADATNLSPRKGERHIGSAVPIGSCDGKEETSVRVGNDSGSQHPLVATPSCAAAPSRPSDGELDWFDAADTEKVRTAKAHLSVSADVPSTEPLCRETHARELSGYLSRHLQERTGCAIYVSGPPGTGKSLTVHHVVSQVCGRLCEGTALPAPSVVSINCMSVQHAPDIFGRILQIVGENIQDAGFSGSSSDVPGGLAEPHLASLDRLSKLVQSGVRASHTTARQKRAGKGMMVVILDELDHLGIGHQDVLNHLFKLPKMAKSKLILIGVANSIDLTIRTLTALEAQDCKPALITFSSYSHGQLLTLLTDRLRHLPGNVFHPLALRLCAKKVAACSGDMRAALEACSAALDEHVASISNTAEGTGPPPLVSVGAMSRAVSTLFGGMGTSSAMVLAIQGLPQQQQLLLCCAAREVCRPQADATPLGQCPPSASKKGKTTPGKLEKSGPRACVWGSLQQAYLRECRRVGLKPLSTIEFGSACSTLADIGLIALGKGHDQMRRMTLRTSLDEIALALNECRIFQGILPSTTH